ncbi:MAG: Rcs stress response system protein RcsF [Colwellia sp.]
MLKKNFLLCLCAFLITSCSNNYSFSTNLDKSNFTEYFAAGEVEIYTEESTLPKPFTFMGIVEGEDCQAKPHHASPQKSNARTAARKQAFHKEANGIIFTGCTEIETKQCTLLLICYAKAYQTSS